MAGAYKLHTDGGARGNPGPAGIGVVLQSPEGEVVAEVGRGIGWATNNVAEYEGLIEGLQQARSHGVTALDVYMDSTLVIEQMKGKWKVKHPGLQPLHAKARKLAREFDRITFRAVPRAQNKHADRLSNKGMDEWEAANPGYGPPEPAAAAAQEELF
ncbi:MAG TPA: reverse transcriptase-like protein [Actinomycetota bacterium]|nr:reverse transcriptase-like protein [Actinomycetota bacterium]